MYRPGHYGVALLAWAPIGFTLATGGHVQLALFGGAVAVGVTPVPDYDHRVPFLEHRGLTHTVAFACLVAVLAGGAGWWIAGGSPFVREAYGSPILVGGVGALAGATAILAHLAADVITPAGIEPFRPVWGKRYSLGWVRAANPVANWGLFLAGVFATGIATVLAVRFLA